MKIAILTFFESDNYGTVLQAYALQHYLNLQGHQAELLYIKRDIYCKSTHYAVSVADETIFERALQKFVALYHRKKNARKAERFQSFREHHLHIGDFCDTDEVLFAQLEKYDLFLNGGDQIWNPHHKSFSYRYMFDFLPETSRRAAYGSSFGIKQINDPQIKNSMAELLSKYNAVSVRDESGVRILADMGISANYVLDPVFLLSAETWKALTGDRLCKKRYCLVYALSDYDKAEERQIRRFAKERNLEVIVMPENRRNRTNFFHKAFDTSPQDFINLIYHADYVFTNSFHGMAFSILFQKQFFLLQSTSAEAKDKYVRLTDLLEILGISERNFSKNTQEIDYSEIQQKLNAYRQDSLNYLNNIVLE